MTGIVRWYDARRGFGIIADNSGRLIFFLGSDWKGPGSLPSANQRVSFEVAQTSKGPNAVRVRCVSAAEQAPRGSVSGTESG